jgi:hypothetical protein
MSARLITMYGPSGGCDAKGTSISIAITKYDFTEPSPMTEAPKEPLLGLERGVSLSGAFGGGGGAMRGNW